MIPSVTSSSIVGNSRDHIEISSIYRSSNSKTNYQQNRQSICSSFDEPFYDCKQTVSPMKSLPSLDISLPKISTCTMTGKSLNNLDECLSTTSSEDKGVQTTFNESVITNSSTSLSSSSTSIQTDSLEHKPISSIKSKPNESSTNLHHQSPTKSCHKWSNIHDRLLSEQTCIYWVNYLGKYIL